MARYDMTLRVLRIIHYFETNRGGLKVSEIQQRLAADGFDKGVRTVHRDLELLQQAYIPIVTEGGGPESRWKLGSYATINNNIHFTYQEIFALYVARESLAHLANTPLFSALDSMFMKLEKALGTDHSKFQDAMKHLDFEPKMTWQASVAPEILEVIYSALQSGRELKLGYRAESGENAGIESVRTVGPECLYFANGSVYLIAVDLKNGEPRTYALARVTQVEIVKDKPYEKRDFSPQTLFKSSIGVFNVGEVEDVELILTGPIAKFYSERKWHDSQTTEETPIGTLFKFQIKVNDELVRFILGMGPCAKVNKPLRLIASVEEAALKVLAHYGRKAS